MSCQLCSLYFTGGAVEELHRNIPLLFGLTPTTANSNLSYSYFSYDCSQNCVHISIQRLMWAKIELKNRKYISISLFFCISLFLSHNSYCDYCENCQMKGSLIREGICFNSRANVAYIYDGSHQYSANSVLFGNTAQDRHRHSQSWTKRCYSKEMLNKSNFSYKLREELKFIISSNFFSFESMLIFSIKAKPVLTILTHL